MSDVRPVWLTRETVTLIEVAARTAWYGMPQIEKDALMGVVKAWDAAPADATEAVTAAVRHRRYQSPTPWIAEAVLHALGMPE
jgi:hypothetical protein